ncbi:MAG: hypothetical protein GC162_10585 [Planctomycetes bacterium]|nr:hypothetical protein [Planctomycetota bacterium]
MNDVTRVRLALVVAYACLLVGIGGCASQREHLRTQSVDLIVPFNVMSGSPITIPVLSASESERLLAMPLPDPDSIAPGLKTEEVIFKITGKRVVWVPRPVESTNTAVIEAMKKWDYRSDYAQMPHDGTTALTVGGVLRGWISGDTELGGPTIRWVGISFDEALDRATHGQALDPSGDFDAFRPEMADTLLLTKEYIIIMAIPVSWTGSSHGDPVK